METLSYTRKLLSDIDKKTKILIKIIPQKTNTWNEWLIQCAKNDLKNIQVYYANFFSSTNSTQQYFSLNNLLIHLNKLIKNMKAVREKTSHRIKPMSYEAWQNEQIQAYHYHDIGMKPNLSKKKYEGYKIDYNQAKHYWEEEMIIANNIMQSEGYKGLETLCKQLHEEVEKTEMQSKNPQQGYQIAQIKHKRPR